jgi:hypothetical protein
LLKDTPATDELAHSACFYPQHDALAMVHAFLHRLISENGNKPVYYFSLRVKTEIANSLRLV